MDLGTRDPAGNEWLAAGPQEAALHALGADLVIFHADGKITVQPDVDVTHYQEALSKARQETLAPRVKAECSRRIFNKIDALTQQNFTAYDLWLQRHSDTLTDQQKSDVSKLEAVYEWLNGESGMLATGRALIETGDLDYAADDKWPAWSEDWNALVSRF